MGRIFAAVTFLALAACTGDTTDTTDSTPTGDSGTVVEDLVSGVWEGACDFPKKKKGAELVTLMYLENDEGVVEGFGTLSVVRGTKTGQRLGFETQGTYDNGAMSLELLLSLYSDLGLDFEGTVDGDMLDGTMMIVNLGTTKKKKKTNKKGVFTCSFTHQ